MRHEPIIGLTPGVEAKFILFPNKKYPLSEPGPPHNFKGNHGLKMTFAGKEVIIVLGHWVHSAGTVEEFIKMCGVDALVYMSVAIIYDGKAYFDSKTLHRAIAAAIANNTSLEAATLISSK